MIVEILSGEHAGRRGKISEATSIELQPLNLIMIMLLPGIKYEAELIIESHSNITIVEE